MKRTLIALLILNSFPTPALAQVVRVAGPVRMSITVPALSAAPAGLSGPALTLSAPSLSPSAMLAPVPVLAVPVALAVSPLITPAPAAAKKPEPQPQGALAVAKTAAASAAEMTSNPGSAEGERSRGGFFDGSVSRPSIVSAVPPSRLWAALRAPVRASFVSSGRPTPPVPPAAAPRLAAFLGGTFLAQVASNALQVTMPLLILQLTGSGAVAAFAATLSSLIDAAGTILGGRLIDRFGSKPVLIATTLARGAAVAALPIAMGAGLTMPLVLGAYAVESLARGAADTARNTLPSELAGRDIGLLKSILSKNQSFFEAGGIAGPFLAGALIAGAGGAAGTGALWLAPVVFAGVAVAYLGLSRRSVSPAAVAAPSAPIASERALDGWMKWALVATALLTLYPLKGVLPAIFATSVLHNPASAAWLVGLFGVGGLIGSIIYGRAEAKSVLKTWLFVGALGTVTLAVAFLPGSFIPAALGVLVFSAANVAARLSLNAALQARASEGKAGASVGAARFTANLSSLTVRFLAGLAFAAALAPAASFWLIGGGILTVAAAQVWTARRLETPRWPGRLIVVEGLDGSGKSTQMEMLKEELEAKGLKVVITTWNSSDMVSEAIKAAKKSQELTPKTFSLLHASDLADRLDKVILPALQEGSIVLADRWFFTALARDRVRGMDAKWLRKLYGFAPKPDLTLYYKLPVETAIGRVLARSEGRLGLSEDYSDDPEAARLSQGRRGLKFYEAGLDAKLSSDPLENFRMFQTRVTAEYDAQAREFGFKTIDSSRSRDEIRADTMAAAFGALGNVAGFKKNENGAAKGNIFDKDPAGDAANIRRNYLNEKRGAHFYFRNMLLPMQERFGQLLKMGSTPRVLLHGSPHVDNYAKSNQGAAMVDFDRSRVGPYSWDLVRLMVSLSLRAKKDSKGLLDKDVLKRMKKGYLRGFRHPDRPFSEYRELKDVEPGDDELTTDAYLAANKKWAKEMRRNALQANDADVVKLVGSWAEGRADGVLNDYFIEEAGRGQGSMGFRGLYLVVLAPRDSHAGRDRILLNIKATRVDPDTEWYKSPYGSEAERMRAAAELHAPGWELRAGGAMLKGVEFYARQLDPLNAKLKKMLTVDEQEDFAYSVGTQLGRAHRLSLAGSTAAEVEAHLEENFGEIVDAGQTIRDELVAAHARYLAKMKRDGLTPDNEGEEE